ncbi:MAG: DUF523 and DUF1722 domain-containing protein [Actinomycetota bacterium]
MPAETLKIGVSQCLVGDAVRYDGADKLNHAVVDRLGMHFELVPVCPEVEAGMGVPRETVQLESSESDLRMVGTSSGADYTDTMQGYAIERVDELSDAQLRGYVLKSRSPSCGLDVAVQGEGGSTSKGLFAAELIKALPGLPAVEETDLADEAKLQNFVERMFAYDRQMTFMSQPRSVGQLVMSHAQARLQLEAHSADAHDQVGRVFEQAGEVSYDELCEQYLASFMDSIATPVTRVAHMGVMKSVFTAIKADLEPTAQKEVARSLQEYRQSVVPLAVPVTLLRHYVRISEHPMFHMQTYLEPGPRELMLRTVH